MKHWYALHTKPHMERQVSQRLAAKEIETYLPLISVRCKRAGQVVRRTQALFPSYLFARADLDAIGLSALRWTPGLRDLVAFGEHPSIVPDALLADIRARVDSGSAQQQLTQPKFSVGQNVRLQSGPFDELDAVFERTLPGRLRAKILVNLLGRLTSVEVDLDQLT